MSGPTRRTFLATAGTGAAAAAAIAATPGALAATGSSSEASAGPAGSPLVAYVEDVAAGRVAILVGEEEVVVQDRDLVRRLTQAAGR